jgi:hypothetical protein
MSTPLSPLRRKSPGPTCWSDHRGFFSGRGTCSNAQTMPEHCCSTERCMLCRCTTPWPRRQVWSKTSGGTYGRKAGPDAPLVCSTSGEYTRAELSTPRFAHHAGVIIPVHAAKPGDIRPHHIPARSVSRKTPSRSNAR